MPLTLALATGLVAAVNPCGFALLPAYLSMLVATDNDHDGAARAVSRALVLTAAMTAGFVAVFGLFGLVVVPLGGSVIGRLPWVTLVIGGLLAVAGGWLLAGRHLPSFVTGPSRAPAVTRSLPSMALFGAAYALASLGCTIGPFLAVVVASLREGSGSVPGGLLLFLAYALGMGLMVGVIAVTIALARTSLVRRVRRAGPMIMRLSGALLVASGCWVAYYGWYELRVLGGDLSPDQLIRFGTEIQTQVASTVGHIGFTWVAGVLLALVVTVAAGRAATVLTARRSARRQPHPIDVPHLVHGVERRDLVRLGQGRVVEHRVD